MHDKKKPEANAIRDVWFIKKPNVVFSHIQTWFRSVSMKIQIWISIGKRDFSSSVDQLDIYSTFINCYDMLNDIMLFPEQFITIQKM